MNFKLFKKHEQPPTADVIYRDKIEELRILAEKDLHKKEGQKGVNNLLVAIESGDVEALNRLKPLYATDEELVNIIEAVENSDEFERRSNMQEAA